MAGPQQKDAFDAVAADFENCREAWPLLVNQYAACVDPARGLGMAQEMIQALRRHNAPWTLAVGLNMAGHTLQQCGLRTEAREAFLESAAISRQCGDHLLLTRALAAAACITFYQH